MDDALPELQALEAKMRTLLFFLRPVPAVPTPGVPPLR